MCNYKKHLITAQSWKYIGLKEEQMYTIAYRTNSSSFNFSVFCIKILSQLVSINIYLMLE